MPAQATSGKFTREDLEFIARARSFLQGRAADSQIAERIGLKKGWSAGAVDYQIRRMVKEKVLAENPIKERQPDSHSI
ncbi:MAG: hypothetical protein N3F07_02340 [Candidatus Micrarchaeota archaeon]|nr:hypothetical protein [Candidatus Micrarchaeota archaeon]